MNKFGGERAGRRAAKEENMMPKNALTQVCAGLVSVLFLLPVRTSVGDNALTPLTPDYLKGRWCYAFIELNGQHEDVSTEYVFRTDGSLEYQNSSISDKMNPGRYALNNGRAKIEPALTFFDFQVDSKREDTFVLRAMGGKHHFLKGSCKNQSRMTKP